MTDFLITQMTLYPWFTWLLVVLAIGGVAWWSVLLGQGVAFVSDWAGHKRESWRYKDDVMRELREHPVRQPFKAGDVLPAWGDRPITQTEASDLNRRCGIPDDPPEYQHPDGDDLDYCEHDVIARTCTRCGYDGLGEDWDAQAGEEWYRSLASPEEFLEKVKAAGLDDTPEDGPPAAEWMGNRCTNRDCYRYGEDHPGACDLAQTQPAACYTDGPAMPPQPVREYLHPAIMDDLDRAGFSEHETTDGAVDSIVMRAVTAEVEAMVTDGIIPADKEGKA